MQVAELRNKRILIAGLGITGKSVARFFMRENVVFEMADDRPDIDIPEPALRAGLLHTELTAELFCGFDVIVLSPGIPRAHPAVAAALASGTSVIGDIELFAGAVQVPVIAVTGSNGKSTVVAWLTDALGACGVKTAACGNIGKAALDSLGIAVDVLILELSSYQLESTYSLRTLASAVLNVSEDHMDRYDSIEHYAAVKRRVYQHAQYCVANHDDARTWPENPEPENCGFFSLEDAPDRPRVVTAAALEDITLSVPGDHNRANALAVLALAAPLELSLTQLSLALPHFRGLPHRSEYIGERDGVRWFNDSKGTNVDACQKAIAAMPGPVVLIAGGMGKGADFTVLRASVRQHVKLLILLGQDRQVIAEQLNGIVETIMVDTLLEAVTLADARAVSGDVVLLSPACASFDMFQNFEDRGEQFKAAVNEVLAA